MAELPRLIAFTGLAGSGKTTAAQYLVDQYGYVRTRFADPLKSMLRAIGLGYEEIDGANKEVPTPLLHGKTPRWAMQTLGTEWGRQCIDAALWTTLWRGRVETCLRQGVRVVVDDCRFANEASAIRQFGGKLVLIERRVGITHSHPSERQILKSDAIILNNDSIALLRKRVDEVVLKQSEK